MESLEEMINKHGPVPYEVVGNNNTLYTKVLRPYKVKRILVMPDGKKITIELVDCEVNRAGRGTSYYRVKNA